MELSDLTIVDDLDAITTNDSRPIGRMRQALLVQYCDLSSTGLKESSPMLAPRPQQGRGRSNDARHGAMLIIQAVEMYLRPSTVARRVLERSAMNERGSVMPGLRWLLNHRSKPRAERCVFSELGT